MKNKTRILVTGAGGFIGHHLVTRLKKEGHWVRGADLKLPQYETSHADEFEILDLRRFEDCLLATRGGIDQVYNLAADMGGIGFITANHAELARNNIFINAHMLEASRVQNVGRFLFSSSACVYAQSKQRDTQVTSLKESDAFPADPEPGYGWEKLYAEQLCLYGPLGTFDGGREKAPAAVCRKVALACDGGIIDIWGDGKQTRSFMYVDDCVEGLLRLMASDYDEPLNLGTDRLVSIDGLVDLVSSIAGKDLTKRHDPSKPQGVRGRNSDNSLLRKTLGWEPSISLEHGLAITYAWIAHELGQSKLEARTKLELAQAR
jgi:GDP-D-mannose 3',5'-epimerase